MYLYVLISAEFWLKCTFFSHKSVPKCQKNLTTKHFHIKIEIFFCLPSILVHASHNMLQLQLYDIQQQLNGHALYN